MFQKIYRSWGERIGDVFVIFVVQEKLLSIEKYIEQTKAMNLTQYMKFYNKIKNLDQQLTKNGQKESLDFIYSQLSLTVDNVFIKDGEDLIFSFRYEQTFNKYEKDKRWQFKDFCTRFSTFLQSISSKMKDIKIVGLKENTNTYPKNIASLKVDRVN